MHRGGQRKWRRALPVHYGNALLSVGKASQQAGLRFAASRGSFYFFSLAYKRLRANRAEMRLDILASSKAPALSNFSFREWPLDGATRLVGRGSNGWVKGNN